MRILLSVINLTNETENTEEMLPNNTTLGNNSTDALSEECGNNWTPDHELISSTIQVII